VSSCRCPADLLAELKRISPLDQNASLLVTELCGKPAGWQASMSDQVMEHFYRRHYPLTHRGEGQWELF
jgi:hypothetical protein